MYPVSDAYLATLTSGSMRSVSRVTASDGTVLAFTGGTVSMDARRGITRSVEAEIVPDGDLDTQDLYDLVMSPGIELTVERGLEVDGSIEYVPLGVFSTDTARIDRDVTGYVRWSGSDRAKKISRARFIDPYQIAAGTTISSAISTLLASRWPDVEVDLSAITGTMGSAVVYSTDVDPWEAARTIASDHGFDLHFDGRGIATVTIAPDPADLSPAFSFGAGDTNLVLGAELVGSFDTTYNGVVASGEGTDLAAPVRAVVWDDDPNSPTYYASSFGMVPYFYSSPLLTTQAACETAARTILSRVKGRAEVLSWPSVVCPALEPLDTVQVVVGGQTSVCIIDALTIPLKASEHMTATAREARRY